MTQADLRRRLDGIERVPTGGGANKETDVSERLDPPTTSAPRDRLVAGRTSRDRRLARRRRAALFARLVAEHDRTSPREVAAERGWPLPIC